MEWWGVSSGQALARHFSLLRSSAMPISMLLPSSILFTIHSVTCSVRPICWWVLLTKNKYWPLNKTVILMLNKVSLYQGDQSSFWSWKLSFSPFKICWQRLKLVTMKWKVLSLFALRRNLHIEMAGSLIIIWKGNCLCKTLITREELGVVSLKWNSQVNLICI